MEYNYVYLDLPEGGKGRVHRSQFEVVEDSTQFFGIRSESGLLKKGSEVACRVLKVPHRFLKGRVVELTALKTSKPVLMCGKSDLDEGKELVAVVRLVSGGALVPLTLEAVGGYVVGVNGWDCNLVSSGEGALLNSIEQKVKVGDVVRVRL